MYKEIFRSGEENQIEDGKGIKSVNPNSNIFHVIMVGFLKDGLAEKVEEVWREMEKMNCAQNVYRYSVKMAAYCEDGKMEDAAKVWGQVGVDYLKPDIVAYNKYYDWWVLWDWIAWESRGEV